MKNNLVVLVLVFLVTFPAYKALRHTGMISGHDAEAAVFKSEEFFNALTDGSFPPRWAKRLDYALGQPTFTFTYTMPYFISSALMIWGFSATWAYKIIMALSFPVAAFGIYIWLKSKFGTWPAVISGVLYAYAPYHLVNVYVRGAIGETVASSLLPFSFYFLDKVKKRTTLKNIASVCLIIMAIILSHLFYGMVFAVVWVAYSLIGIGKLNLKKIGVTLAIVGWGYVNCAYYILPALAYKNLTFLDGIEGYFLRTQYFVNINDLLSPSWGFAAFQEIEKGPMSVQIGAILLVLFLGWVALEIFGRNKQNTHRLEAGFFGLLTIGATLMMFPISLVVWKTFSPLMAMQFPWRMLFLVNLGTAFCAGFYLQRLKIKWAAAGLLIGLTIFISRDYWQVGRYYVNEFHVDETIGYPGTLTMLLEETPKWHKNIEEANPYNFFQYATGSGDLKSLVWKTNYHKFEVDAVEASVVNDKTHYWPGWRVWVDGKETNLISPEDDLSRGLITFKVSPGIHIVESRLTEPLINKIGDGISLVSVVTALGMVLFKKDEQTV